MEVVFLQIEVIVQNFVDAIKAQELGADRLELVIGIEEGGLTPSYGKLLRVCLIILKFQSKLWCDLMGIVIFIQNLK